MTCNIIDKLNGDLTEYKSIPFWSWNDKLTGEHLRKQIREMNEAGIGGFFMHARGGLMTEYMGDEWFDCVGECIDEAKKQGMHAWCYDENGWPSGFAGMKLLKNPENHAHYIVIKHQEQFDARALGCYRVVDGELIRVTGDDGAGCECVYDCTNDSVVDILNWKVVRSFIEETHDRYYRRFGKYFGKILMGFFTDEPQYYRWDTAYSPAMQNKYRTRYGEELSEELGALFLDCRQANRFRYRYWLLMNELYTEAFAGQIYRWCTEHNCQLTGHSIEEASLFGNMMCCGGIMPFYEYEHIPGVDWLGRDISTEATPRQCSSVAMQLGKKHVLTESFAGCGWDVSPVELKHVLEWQFVNGVNLVCQHLYPYSIRGQRKRDFPAFYSNHNPWTTEFRRFNDYFTRLGYMLAESREIADTVVIHPIHSTYFTFNRNNPSTLSEQERKFSSLIEKLGAAGIIHHYADETLLRKYGKVNGKKLTIGRCTYSTVIVPDMIGLDESTVEILTEFAKAGGRIWFEGEKLPHLVSGEEKDIGLASNITYEEIGNPGFFLTDKTTDIRITVRRSEFGDFLYAVNLSTTKKQSTVFHINAKGARRFDLEKAAFEPVYFEKSERGIDIPIDLDPCASTVIFFSATAESAAKEPEREVKAIPAPQAIIMESGPNTLTIDMARLSYDGETYTDVQSVMAISDRLLREKTNRTVYLKYNFTVNAKPACLRLEAEDMNGAEARLNGTVICSDRQGSLEEQFRSYDISRLVRLGNNELIFRLDYYQPEHTYKVFNGIYYDHDGTTESVLNCLSYYTDIEAVYLRGDFCVETGDFTKGQKAGTLLNDGPFAITLARKYVNLNTLHTDGYPFFGGTMKVRTVLAADGNEKYMRLPGRFAWCKVSINGGKEHLIMLGSEINVEGELRRGDNDVVFTIANSLRNVMGVFHHPGDRDPHLYGPDSVTRYGSWKKEPNPDYDPSYCFVFFGIDRIELR